jgi:hypothetical protein
MLIECVEASELKGYYWTSRRLVNGSGCCPTTTEKNGE